MKNKYFKNTKIKEKDFEQIVAYFSRTFSATHTVERFDRQRDSNQRRQSISRETINKVYTKLRERIHVENEYNLSWIENEHESEIYQTLCRIPKTHSDTLGGQNEVKRYLWIRSFDGNLVFHEMSKEMNQIVERIEPNKERLDLHLKSIIGLLTIDDEEDILFHIGYSQEIKEFRESFKEAQRTYRRISLHKFVYFANETAFKRQFKGYASIKNKLLEMLDSKPIEPKK